MIGIFTVLFSDREDVLIFKITFILQLLYARSFKDIIPFNSHNGSVNSKY